MASEGDLYREVMATEALVPASPFEATTLDFVFGQVWARSGPQPQAASSRDACVRLCRRRHGTDRRSHVRSAGHG